MSTSNVNILKPGDTFSVNFYIENISTINADSVQVVITNTAGVVLSGSNTNSIGAIVNNSPTQNTWQIPTVFASQKLPISITYTILDTATTPWTISWNASTTTPETQLNNNAGSISLDPLTDFKIQETVDASVSESKYSVPGSAFADVVRPALTEVKAWASVPANVPTIEQNNGTVLEFNSNSYLETPVYNNIEIVYYNTQTLVNLYINADPRDGDAATDIFSPAWDLSSSAAFDEVAADADLTANLAALSLTGDVSITDEIDSNGRIIIAITNQVGISKIAFSEAAGANPVFPNLTPKVITNNHGYKTANWRWLLSKNLAGFQVTLLETSPKDTSKLYVSKSLGNNITAEFGNISKPWKDPVAAITAADPGDTIHVLDGMWTIGIYDSGKDIILDNNDSQLIKSGVNQYWEEGTGLINQATTPRSMFTIPGTGHFTSYIEGFGEFTGGNYSIFNVIKDGVSRDIDIIFNGKKLTYNNIAVDLKQSNSISFTSNFKEVVVDFVGSIDNYGMFFYHTSTVTTNITSDSYLNLTCDSYTLKQNGVDGYDVSERGIANIENVSNNSTVIAIKNLYQEAAGNYLLGGFGGWQANCNNNAMVFNIDNMVMKNAGIVAGNFSTYTIGTSTELVDSTITTGAKLPSLVWLYLDNLAADCKNNSIAVNINNYEGNIPVSAVMNTQDENTFVCENNSITINVGNAKTNNNSPVVATYSVGPTVATDQRIMVNVDHGVANTENAIYCWANSNAPDVQAIISGNYYTMETAKSSVVLNDTLYTDGALQLKNIKLINADNTVPAITTLGGVLVEVQTIAAITNVEVAQADSNIDEIGEAVTRDNRIK